MPLGLLLTDGGGARLLLEVSARAEHGWDPEAGRVTVVVHAFVGDDEEAVRQTACGAGSVWPA